jgi:hypothetical protein
MSGIGPGSDSPWYVRLICFVIMGFVMIVGTAMDWLDRLFRRKG